MSVTPKSQSQTIFYEISFKVRVDYNPTPPPPTLAFLLTLFQCFNYVKFFLFYGFLVRVVDKTGLPFSPPPPSF